ncbi:MAG: hypothetical protein R2712_12770 [Vicinamibacterales bacterium]
MAWLVDRRVCRRDRRRLRRRHPVVRQPPAVRLSGRARQGAAVARVTRVAGWALDDGHVRRVDEYVDGRFVGSSTPVHRAARSRGAVSRVSRCGHGR